MKKIAIFQTDLNIGGIQKSILNLINNIDYKKYEIDLYLFNKENVFINDISKNVNVIYLKPMIGFTKGIYFNILNIFYKNKIKKCYDVAIDYNSYSMDTALATINCNAKKRVIFIHNDIKVKLKEEFKYRCLHRFFKKKYKYFDEFIAVSKGALDSFKEYHSFENKVYRVIPNMIDTSEILEKSKELVNVLFDKKKYNLCSIGRLCHQKGFDILINDIKELTKFRNDFHLYIIGDGELKFELENQIIENDLSDYITLCGYKSNPYAYMSKMDGFILESRYEGQGMVFLEAKCLGLDIIMPRHLEKYVDGIDGTDNILESLCNVAKHPKKIDMLKEYNEDVITKIENMFN